MESHGHGIGTFVLLVAALISLIFIMNIEPTNGIKLRFKTMEPSEKIQEQLANIAQKTCLAGLKGVDCLAKRRAMVPSSTLSLLFAGVGYDRWTHTVKPPVFRSGEAQPAQSQETISGTFGDARQFYSMIYPVNGQSTFYNGIYTHNGGSQEMFNQFFSGSMHAIDAQTQFVTHQVSSSNQVTEDFKNIIDILPETMDEELYKKVIEFFGDSIATSVKYGGVVDSTVSVRSCFSDGNMENYVRSELNNVLTGNPSGVPDGYIRYHRVSQLDIAGGNPQVASIPERVATFEQNPVPIKFETVPIWQAFPEGPKRENMKAIYDNYVASKRNIVEDMINQLEAKRVEEANSPQRFVGYGRNKNGIIIGLGEGTVAMDQTVEFSRLNYNIEYYMGLMARQTCQGVARINRHHDLSFHMDLIQDCVVQGRPFNMGNPVSSTVAQGCTSMGVPSGGNWRISYNDVNEVIVCSGCQPYISPDGRQLSCSCPYVQ